LGKKSDIATIGDDTPWLPTDRTWPRALRRVRSWLAPWTFLGRCCRAWSNAPPAARNPEALTLAWYGQPLNLYLRV
jgi:hypothetical protein